MGREKRPALRWRSLVPKKREKEKDESSGCVEFLVEELKKIGLIVERVNGVSDEFLKLAAPLLETLGRAASELQMKKLTYSKEVRGRLLRIWALNWLGFTEQPIDEVYSYFGTKPHIFAFLGMYTRWLVFPAALGLTVHLLDFGYAAAGPNNAAASPVRGQWARRGLLRLRHGHCDACRRAPCAVFCRADEAYLCTSCDESVHAANRVASRLSASGSAKVASVPQPKLTCRADNAARRRRHRRRDPLRQPLARRHHRVPNIPYSIPVVSFSGPDFPPPVAVNEREKVTGGEEGGGCVLATA
ncbi:hypothetical protein J5N97_004922 [Dioscorea zingiberensis]|uniref:B box-type domain-containing protein n=1 Tax=Dioscorea zingiberensis TaxID=325984 RepID=A0A9D5HSA5_9LILI|nr:hypothetical protein J5N97_004922 [Dioscorea zingiberensis]